MTESPEAADPLHPMLSMTHSPGSGGVIVILPTVTVPLTGVIPCGSTGTACDEPVFTTLTGWE